MQSKCSSMYVYLGIIKKMKRFILLLVINQRKIINFKYNFHINSRNAHRTKICIVQVCIPRGFVAQG